jgi:hypothetical protein
MTLLRPAVFISRHGDAACDNADCIDCRLQQLLLLAQLCAAAAILLLLLLLTQRSVQAYVGGC